MTAIEVSVAGVDEVLAKLDALSTQTRNKVIKKATNAALKDAKSLVKKKVSAVYMKKQKDVSDTFSQKKATTSDGEAILYSRGKVLEPLDYSATPKTMAAQAKRTVAAKAKILRKGKLKALTIEGRKAFLAPLSWSSKSGASGTHLAIMQRKGQARYPIVKLLSTSIPTAIGAHRIESEVSPVIRDKLAEYLMKYTEEVMGTK